MTKIQTQTISRGHEIYSNKTNIRMEELEISLDERSEYTLKVSTSVQNRDRTTEN